MISEGGEREREKVELGGRLREGGMMEGREGRIIVSCLEGRVKNGRDGKREDEGRERNR